MAATCRLRRVFRAPPQQPSLYGGNLSISGNLFSNGSKIELVAQSGVATELKGTFSQTAVSEVYGGEVRIFSGGNATISGEIAGTSSVLIDAGWDNFNDVVTLYGGNLLFRLPAIFIRVACWRPMRKQVL